MRLDVSHSTDLIFAISSLKKEISCGENGQTKAFPYVTLLLPVSNLQKENCWLRIYTRARYKTNGASIGVIRWENAMVNSDDPRHLLPIQTL